MKTLTWILLLALPLALQAATPPNIVFILADDLGIGDVNCYGGERCQIDTPNIDGLARDGMRFTDAHVNASVCVPTRVAIMTGRYPWRYAPTPRGGPWGYLAPRFGTDRLTLGDMMQSVGYRTGYVGKWHLGTTMVTKDGEVQGPENVDYTKPLTMGPPQHGFDESFILPGSLDMFPYAFVRNNVWKGKVTAQKGWSAFNRVGPAAEDFKDHQVLETFYREAEAFIGKQKPDQPFFLFLALTAPHTPISPGKAWQGKSRLGVYGDLVMEVDHSVGRVRKALEKRGLADNTLLLFSSDHGPGSYAGNILQATPGQIRELEKLGHYANGPHRGYKFSALEGGLRVPLLACWPGVTQAGSACDELVGLHDFMATFAELSGAKLGDADGPDSISFASLLRDPLAEGKRQTMILEGSQAYVFRDGPWKLLLTPGSGASGKMGNEPPEEVAWKAALEDYGKTPTRDALRHAPFVQLYHVDSDPHEDENLAAKHPERVEQMLKQMEQQVQDGRTRPGPPVKNGGEDIDLFRKIPPFVRKALQ